MQVPNVVIFCCWLKLGHPTGYCSTMLVVLLKERENNNSNVYNLLNILRNIGCEADFRIVYHRTVKPLNTGYPVAEILCVIRRFLLFRVFRYCNTFK